MNHRIASARLGEQDALDTAIAESERIQRRLWRIAVAVGLQDPHSQVAALYVTSLNQLIDLHALRVVIGLRARVPTGIWIALYALIILGMAGVGFQNAIAEANGRSWAPFLLALSFSVVIALIASLDRPLNGFVTVSQRPLAETGAWMDSGTQAGVDPADKP